MGRNRNSVFQVMDTRDNDIVQVDSNEEVLVYKWLLYAQKIGVVQDFQYQPCTFVLSPKVQYQAGKKSRTLFQDHVYSPDFLIQVNPAHQNLIQEFKVPFGQDSNMIYVDVKGSFNRNQRSFSIDQKWVWQKEGFYIYKLEPKVFFKKFGILDEFKFTQKTRKPSKVFQGYNTIDEIFHQK